MKATRAICAAVLMPMVVSFASESAIAAPPTHQTSAQPATQSPAGRTPRTVLLKEGTEVSLKLAQSLSGKTSVVGEPVEMVLAEDLKVGNAVVVKQGARVLGTVVAGKAEEKDRRSARELALRVDFLPSGDARIKLRGEKSAEGKRNKDAMIAGTILLGVSGLLLTSGKKYSIPEGTPLKAYVAEDIQLPELPN